MHVSHATVGDSHFRRPGDRALCAVDYVGGFRHHVALPSSLVGQLPYACSGHERRAPLSPAWALCAPRLSGRAYQAAPALGWRSSGDGGGLAARASAASPQRAYALGDTPPAAAAADPWRSLAALRGGDLESDFLPLSLTLAQLRTLIARLDEPSLLAALGAGAGAARARSADLLGALQRLPLEELREEQCRQLAGAVWQVFVRSAVDRTSTMSLATLLPILRRMRLPLRRRRSESRRLLAENWRRITGRIAAEAAEARPAASAWAELLETFDLIKEGEREHKRRRAQACQSQKKRSACAARTAAGSAPRRRSQRRAAPRAYTNLEGARRRAARRPNCGCCKLRECREGR